MGWVVLGCRRACELALTPGISLGLAAEGLSLGTLLRPTTRRFFRIAFVPAALRAMRGVAGVRALARRANPVSSDVDVIVSRNLLGVGGKITPRRVLGAAAGRTMFVSFGQELLGTAELTVPQHLVSPGHAYSLG
jgi:hypothetical protein